jgi:YHS domain-containing protein
MNKNSRKELTVRDPVCGMWIEPEDAVEIELYKGRIFYFCAQCCKKNFVDDPEHYLIADCNEQTNSLTKKEIKLN